jgi:hypothetical protein
LPLGRLTTRPDTRAVRLAFGYFWDLPCAAAVTKFRGEAPQVLERLRKLNWSVGLDAGRWQRESKEVDELLAHQGMQEKFGAEWRTLADQVQAALAAASGRSDHQIATGREAERQFGLLVMQAQQFKSKLYGAALEALLKEANR